MNTICQPANFLHVGNILFLIAYLVRDVLWLRVITVVATVSMIVSYFLLWTSSSGVAIAWCFVVHDRKRRANCDSDSRAAARVSGRRGIAPVPHDVQVAQAARVSASALHCRVAARRVGDELLAQQKPVPALMLLTTGRGIVELDGRHVADVFPGQFVGEMGYLTEQDASARVVASATTDYLAWPTAKLRSLLAAAPTLHVKFQAVLGCDLVSKLHHEAVSAAHPSRVATALRSVGVE